MEIEKRRNDDKLEVSVTGRLDTMTAPELETALNESTEDIRELCLDLNGLEYISSAGLRVLLAAQKKMNGQGSMKVTGVGEAVMEIFEVTGFSEILTIE